MIVLNCTVRKIDHNDPRYPDPINGTPFSDVYLCEIETDHGPQESAFFMTDVAKANPSQKLFADMLALFSRSIREMKIEKSAA